MRPGAALVLWLFSPIVLAASPQMHEFDYGIPLQVDGDGALYRFSLPAEVYQFTRYADMRDLMIFNSKGERLPHLLLEEPTGESRRIDVTPLRLPTHPIVPRTPDEDELLPADESILDYYSGQLPLEGAGAGEYYLIDAREAFTESSATEGIQLIWDSVAEPLLAQVSIHGSDDLSSWQLLVDKQAVAQKSHQGVDIVQNRITLPAPLKPYYRLHWPPGSQGVELQKLQFIFRTNPSSVPASTIRITAGEGSREGSYTFQLSGHYPVSRIQLGLSRDNFVLRGKLFSRRNEQEPWQLRYQGFFYDIEQDGHRLISEPISVPPQRHAQWRFESMSDSPVEAGVKPELTLSWRPHQLYFFAQGEMPFTLAFGKGPLRESALPSATLLAAVEDGRSVKSAGLGSHYELAASHTLIGSEWLRNLAYGFGWLVIPVLLLVGVIGWRYFSANRRDEMLI